jgi:poly-gamma-glutamate capsule biosynthesis protein CapA/YwtB (metallophosphatase superfamily)
MKRYLDSARSITFGYLTRIARQTDLARPGFRRKAYLLLALPVLLVSSVKLLRGQERATSTPEFNITMVGDAEIVTPAVPRQGNPQFMSIVNAVRQGDAAFANVEEPFPTSNRAYPAGLPRRQWHTVNPTMLEQLQWIGFNLFGAANNHSMDFGIQGLLETMEVYKKDKAVFAGIGENLGEARAPAYLTTAHGRVALITAASFFPEDSAAGQSRTDMQGRPGISPLHHKTIYRVDASTFANVRKMSRDLYLGGGGSESSSPQTVTIPFDGAALTFEQSDKPDVATSPDPRDMAALLHSIRDARKMADVVVASIHTHEGAYGPDPLETPAQFLVTYAHAAIDAGADVFVGSGPHVLRGIEIYKGKVILYSLGNFIFENWLMEPEPTEFYETYGVGPEALPAEAYDARSDNGRRDEVSNPIYWKTAVARVTFRDGRPALVTLTPAITGFGRKAPDQGYPEVPDPAMANQILENLQKISEPFGTKIVITNGIGTISIPK